METAPAEYSGNLKNAIRCVSDTCGWHVALYMDWCGLLRADVLITAKAKDQLEDRI